MFRIDYDPDANRLKISVWGFMDPGDVTALATAVGAKAREARAIGGDFDVIVESLEFPVQANDVADMLTEIMRSGMALTTGRAAVVVGSFLNKLQAERTLVHPRLQVFSSMEEARSWLDQSSGSTEDREIS